MNEGTTAVRAKPAVIRLVLKDASWSALVPGRTVTCCHKRGKSACLVLEQKIGYEGRGEVQQRRWIHDARLRPNETNQSDDV